MCGSVTRPPNLPRRLLYTHQFTFIRQPTETDPRHPKQLRNGPRPTREHAPVPYPRERAVPRQLRQLVPILLPHFDGKLRIFAEGLVELPPQLEPRREQPAPVIGAVSLHPLLRAAVFRRRRGFGERRRDVSGLGLTEEVVRRFEHGLGEGALAVG